MPIVSKISFVIFYFIAFTLTSLFLINACGGLDTKNQTAQDGPKKKPLDDGNKNKTDLALVCQDILALTDPAPLKDLSELAHRFLSEHNNIRRKMNLKELTWDSSLADYAQRWAEYLKKNNHCLMKHRSDANMREGKKFGENLAYNWTDAPIAKGQFDSSPEAVVISFSKECQDYDYQSNSCKANKKCGHFTQVIWRDSLRVGCGMVICDGAENDRGNGHAELWVCNYDPRGNWVGQRPF